MRCSLLSVLLMVVVDAAAQQQRYSPVAGFAEVEAFSRQPGVFSGMINQAALAGNTGFAAGFTGEQRFLLKDLQHYGMVMAFPVGQHRFGVSGNHFGNTVYRETEVGIAYARRISKLDIGVQFNYSGIRIGAYGSGAAYCIAGGAILQLTDELRAGMHIYNPTRSGYGSGDAQPLPVMYTAGLGYDLSERFFIGISIRKEEGRNTGLYCGSRYTFSDRLLARIGISTAERSFYIGAGVQLKGLQLLVTTSCNPLLGLSPQLGLQYQKPSL